MAERLSLKTIGEIVRFVGKLGTKKAPILGRSISSVGEKIVSSVEEVERYSRGINSKDNNYP